MSWHQGGKVRCASATYAGRYVVEPPYEEDPFSAWIVTTGGNARQRRKQVRELKRHGYRVSPGGVAS
jgi:hypothetical protein